MGNLALSDFRDEVQRHLANRTDLSDATLTRAINIGQVQLARMHDFQELRILATPAIAFANTASDRFLSKTTILSGINNTIREMMSFVISDDADESVKVVQKSPRAMDKSVGDPVNFNTRRIPKLYTIWKDNLELFPLPDKAYTSLIRLTLWPVWLTQDADLSEFLNKDDILIHLATSYLYHSLGEYERATKFFGIAVSNAKTASREDATRPDEEIKPAFEFRDGQSASDYWKDPFIRSIR